MKLALGNIVTTSNLMNTLTEELGDSGAVVREIAALLLKHSTGDWGTVDAEDKKANDDAVKHGGRLLSAYQIGEIKVWIITEWDRSVTTVLLPEDY